jgi:hypothetical protein
MNTKVFIYAQPHEEKHRDKVLVIKEPDRNVVTLPQGDVTDQRPEWAVHDILKKQTGFAMYPDRRRPGICFSDCDFIKFPVLKGKVVAGDSEVLCYTIEVNERHKPEGDAIWLPWNLLRHDDCVSPLSRFVMALLYSEIAGWELTLDKSGVWRIACMSVSYNRSNLLEEILSGEIQAEVSDTLIDIIHKSNANYLKKREKKNPQKQTQPPKKRSWFWWLGF